MFQKILVGYDGSKGGQTALRRAAAMAKELKAQLAACWVREPLPRYTDLPGEPDEAGFDLIVVGHSDHSELWGRLLGDTADRISDHAHCSVLVVKK